MKGPARAPALLAGLSALIAFILLLAAWGELSGTSHLGWVRVPVQGVRHEGGHAYLAGLPSARWSSIDAPSRALVLEAGRPLGPGNAAHDDIRKHGGGRFSFWGDTLYLSASDNSDPAGNGRPYEAWGPGPHADELRALLFLLTLAATGLSLWLMRGRAVAVASSLVLVAAVTAVVIRWIGIPAEGTIDTASIARRGDSPVWVAPLPYATSWLRPLADVEGAPPRSDLELLENGRPLGPAHADSPALERGGGAFSHTSDGSSVAFTTTDSSDPRSNGRIYSYRTRLRASLRDAVNLALAFCLLTLWGLIRKHRASWMPVSDRGGAPMAQVFLKALSSLRVLAWMAALVLTLWLGWSGWSPEVAAWAPLQDPHFGHWILEGEKRMPLVLLVIAGLGHLLFPRRADETGKPGALALVPFLFCLGYFCSIYRPESLYGLDLAPTSNFLGYLPYSDAADYYEGARRLVDVGDLSDFAARRPANAAWLALRLSVAGTLAGATLLQVILAGLAVSYLGFVVRRLAGAWSSLAVVALAYAYCRFFFTTTLSEASGFTFGALGAGLVLSGLRSGKERFVIAGMSALGLAESFRAGALLAPLGLVIGLVLSAKPRRRLALGLLAAGSYLATLLVSPGLNAIYGSGKGQTGANLAWVAAGLSLGETWGAAEAKYAPELAPLTTEVERARLLYSKAAENVRRDPWPAIRAIGRSFRLLESQTPELFGNLTGAAGFGSVVVALLLAHRMVRRLGVPLWLLRIGAPFAGGVLLCIPVIYLDGGWRVLAASAPLIFTFVSLLVATPDDAAPEVTRPDRIAACCPALLMVSMAVLPGPVHRLTSRPDTSCLPPGWRVLRHPSREPAVLYEAGAASSRQGIPVVTPERVAAQERYADNNLILPEPPVLLDWAYDYSSHGLVTLAAPPDLLDVREGFVWVQTAPLGPPPNHRVVNRFGAWSGCDARK